MALEDDVDLALQSIDKALKGAKEEHEQEETLAEEAERKANLLQDAERKLNEALELAQSGNKEKGREKVNQASEELKRAAEIDEDEEQKTVNLEKLEEREQHLTGKAMEALMNLHNMEITGEAPK